MRLTESEYVVSKLRFDILGIAEAGRSRREIRAWVDAIHSDSMDRPAIGTGVGYYISNSISKSERNAFARMDTANKTTIGKAPSTLTRRFQENDRLKLETRSLKYPMI